MLRGKQGLRDLDQHKLPHITVVALITSLTPKDQD